MREPRPSLALVDPEALQPVEQILREPGRRTGQILQDEHPDTPGFAVLLRQKADRLGGCGGFAQRVGDPGKLAGRPVAQEGEREVQVLTRDDPAVTQVALLPPGQRVERSRGKPQRAEEP